MPTQQKEVYLTFDDGPTPEITDWVLSQLEEFEQKASFFCIGNNVVQHPDIIQRIKDKGHSLGNHTYNHLNGFRVSTSKYLEDVQRCADVLESKLFRPPYGRISRPQLKALSEEYKIVEWTVISRDYYSGLKTEQSLNALKKNTIPGAIIVFHDSQKASENLYKLLPAYLEFLREKGIKSRAL